MTTVFQPNVWLREALGEAEHSPLKVDAFELAQGLREIRQDVSQQKTTEAREARVAELRAATVDDAEFVRLVGAKQAKELGKLLGSPGQALVYGAGGALEKPSSIRAELVDILAGEYSDRFPVFRARELANSVSLGELHTAVAQVEEALSQLDQAFGRLPPRTPLRLVNGTYYEGDARDARTTLELTVARLRQPTVARQIDDFFAMPALRPFTSATLADIGVDRQAFRALASAIKDAVRSAAPGTSEDVRRLWAEAKAQVGYDICWSDRAVGFARIGYKNGRGLTFAEDVEKLERYLARHVSFKAGSGRPTC